MSFQTIQETTLQKIPFSVALDDSISDGAAGILSLGGYLMFFSILTLIPREFLHLSDIYTQMYICILEITNGLSYSPDLPPYILLSLLQFGGICCIFQTIKYISKTDLSFKKYIQHKSVLTFITLAVFFVLDVFFCVF